VSVFGIRKLPNFGFVPVSYISEFEKKPVFHIAQ
jgi:hypothetical protein